jgi:hypothetical protein
MGIENPLDPNPDQVEEEESTGDEPDPSGKARKHPEKQEPIKP